MNTWNKIYKIFVEGTLFLLFDAMQYFNKEEPTDVKREMFTNIINQMFRNTFSLLQREAITFQVSKFKNVV